MLRSLGATQRAFRRPRTYLQKSRCGTSRDEEHTVLRRSKAPECYKKSEPQAGQGFELSGGNSGENRTRSAGATARQERFNVKRAGKRDNINNESVFDLTIKRAVG